MAAESFSAELRRLADPVWEAQHRHPFVRGIGDGSLALESFRHWVRQDYVFLVDYCRLFALAAARAPDLATMTRFADLLHATLATEMELHRGYAAEFGISVRGARARGGRPRTRGYVDFLLRTAPLGDYLELVAALRHACGASAEIGQVLARGRGRPTARYAAWIDMYAAPEFAELSALVPRPARPAGGGRLTRGARPRPGGVRHQQPPRAAVLGGGLHPRGLASLIAGRPAAAAGLQEHQQRYRRIQEPLHSRTTVLRAATGGGSSTATAPRMAAIGSAADGLWDELGQLGDDPLGLLAAGDALNVLEAVLEAARVALPGRAGHVRCEQGVLELQERVVRRRRLLAEDVEAGAGDRAAARAPRPAPTRRPGRRGSC